ncbi:MAG: hypothetical protein ACYC1R_10955 [Coriobacteriia bacterium]
MAKTPSIDKKALPEHVVVSDTDISVGSLRRRRIEIHVEDSDLTKPECRALIEAYAPRAGDQGQVSVHKPDWTGTLQPWGVDNMDGKGVVFNDDLFVKPVEAPPAPTPTPAPAPAPTAPSAPSSLAQKHYDARDTYFTSDMMTSWTRAQMDATFAKDGGRAVDEVWPMGQEVTWVEVKYAFPDSSWFFVSYGEDMENLGGPQSSWRIQDAFLPGEAR